MKRLLLVILVLVLFASPSFATAKNVKYESSVDTFILAPGDTASIDYDSDSGLSVTAYQIKVEGGGDSGIVHYSDELSDAGNLTQTDWFIEDTANDGSHTRWKADPDKFTFFASPNNDASVTVWIRVFGPPRDRR